MQLPGPTCPRYRAGVPTCSCRHIATAEVEIEICIYKSQYMKILSTVEVFLKFVAGNKRVLETLLMIFFIFPIEYYLFL